MKVEIWSDVVCPWCYIGKRHFEQALARFDHRDEVEIVWRSYELDPTAPPVREGTTADYLSAKYGWSKEQVDQAHERVEVLPGRVGLEVEAQPDRAEADRRLLVDAERAAEVEIAVGVHGAGHRDAE